MLEHVYYVQSRAIKRETKDDHWSKEDTEFDAVLAYERSNVFSKS